MNTFFSFVKKVILTVTSSVFFFRKSIDKILKQFFVFLEKKIERAGITKFIVTVKTQLITKFASKYSYFYKNYVLRYRALAKYLLTHYKKSRAEAAATRRRDIMAGYIYIYFQLFILRLWFMRESIFFVKRLSQARMTNVYEYISRLDVFI